MKNKRQYTKFNYTGDEELGYLVQAHESGISKTKPAEFTQATTIASLQILWNRLGKKTYVPSGMAVVDAVSNLKANVSAVIETPSPVCFLFPIQAGYESIIFYHGTVRKIRDSLKELSPKAYAIFNSIRSDVPDAIITLAVSSSVAQSVLLILSEAETANFLAEASKINLSATQGHILKPTTIADSVRFAIKFQIAQRAGLIVEGDMPKSIDIGAVKTGVVCFKPSDEHSQYFNKESGSVTVVNAFIRELRNAMYSRDAQGNPRLIVVSSYVRRGKGRSVDLHEEKAD